MCVYMYYLYYITKFKKCIILLLNNQQFSYKWLREKFNLDMHTPETSTDNIKTKLFKNTLNVYLHS